MEYMTDEQIDAALRRQVYRLDLAFHDFVAIALNGSQPQLEMNVALRAQSQCRATAHTVKHWQKQDSPPVTS